jgi:enterochelin esterase-like enzyme
MEFLRTFMLGLAIMGAVAQVIAQEVVELEVQTVTEGVAPGGRLERIPDFPSQHVDTREVWVWVPTGLPDTTRFGVLYMHDGGMLFQAGSTWNGQAWEIDEVVPELIRTGQVEPFIVVGVASIPARRHAEFFPAQPFAAMSADERAWVSDELNRAGRWVGGPFVPASDAYLAFLVQELKPFIDAVYPTRPEARYTRLAGSSMGGLISLYGLCAYPEVFGGAACLSTHWPGVFGMNQNPVPEAMRGYLASQLHRLDDHRLYFDCGDATLDAMYPPLQDAVDRTLEAEAPAGLRWSSQRFPGADHSERSWNARLHVPLTFLWAP